MTKETNWLQTKWCNHVIYWRWVVFGLFFIDILKGVGLLVAAIGVGSVIAGYLYPNESAEITKAVEKFEE